MLRAKIDRLTEITWQRCNSSENSKVKTKPCPFEILFSVRDSKHKLLTNVEDPVTNCESLLSDFMAVF